MKKLFLILLFAFSLSVITISATAQCSICSKSVMQMGSKPAKGFNSGILYLMFIPYAAIGFVGYKWYKSQQPKP